jgi:iron complex transport system substrate-binding protein
VTARRRLPLGLLAGALLAAVLVAGCGSSTLTGSQLRSSAARICALAAQRTDRIGTPTLPTQETAFLRRGIAALTPELRALRRLRAPGDMTDEYRDAVAATASELARLRSAAKGLRAGNDPVVAIKTLQQQLAAPEARARSAWTTLELPACRDD